MEQDKYSEMARELWAILDRAGRIRAVLLGTFLAALAMVMAFLGGMILITAVEYFVPPVLNLVTWSAEHVAEWWHSMTPHFPWID